jgi:putative holliday junction resolvase
VPEWTTYCTKAQVFFGAWAGRGWAGSAGARYTGEVNGGQGKAGAKRARILAIDYGEARVGMAIADLEARIAEPLGTLQRMNRNEDLRRLRQLAREEGVQEIVIGLPLNLDGTRGAMAKKVAGFARRVRKQIGIPVVLVDERLTTWEAERVMQEEFGKRVKGPAGVKRSEDRISVDSVAAVVILREYLAGMKGPWQQSVSI